MFIAGQRERKRELWGEREKVKKCIKSSWPCKRGKNGHFWANKTQYALRNAHTHQLGLYYWRRSIHLKYANVCHKWLFLNHSLFTCRFSWTLSPKRSKGYGNTNGFRSVWKFSIRESDKRKDIIGICLSASFVYEYYFCFIYSNRAFANICFCICLWVTVSINKTVKSIHCLLPFS